MAVTIRLIALTLVLMLAACARPDSEFNFTSAQAPISSNIRSTLSTPDSRLATAHNFYLQLPSTEIEKVQQKHLEECAKIKCKVQTAGLDRSSEGRVSARTRLRLAPEAYAAFATILVAPPATLQNHSETTEDSSQPAIDIERRLQSKYALRDRLTAMLRDSAAKTAAEAVAIEKELAQVQSDIETAEAQREQIRNATETIRIDISYQGKAAQIAGLDLTPVTHVAKAAGQTLVSSVAMLVWFVIAAAPWLPLIALLLWGARRYFRRKAQPAPLPQP